MAVIESANKIEASLRRAWRIGSAPVNGTTLAAIADIGDLLIRNDAGNAALFQNTNTKASPTWTQIVGGVTLGATGAMAAAGTSTANAAGNGTTASPINHVHAIGDHDHSAATKGNAVAMGLVGSMAASGTSTANAAGTGTLPAAIDHVHKVGDHDHSDNTKGNTIVLAAIGASMFTADAAGRGKFANGFVNTALLLDGLLSANAAGQAKMAAGFLSADATGRAFFAAGIFNAATCATVFAANSFDATACANAFADNAIPGSKVNWSYGATASTITPDDSASAGTAATVSRSDHVHANTCGAPADGSLAAANAEGVAVNFARQDHAHRAVLLNSVEIEFGTTYDAVMGWEVGDISNPTLVIGLADANQALHISDKTAIVTDWNVGADTHPSLYIHSDTTPATDYLKLYHNATDGIVDSVGGDLVLMAGSAERVSIESGIVTFNDGSADVDYKVEANGIEFAVYVDGGKDALVLGSNTDTSSADQLITVSRAARTATATVNYYDLAIQPAGAVTVPAGVTAIVASMYLAEPNITATGTVTAAATLYIAGAPTEGGTSNNAIHVAAGTCLMQGATFGGTVVLGAQQLSLSTGNVTFSGAGYIAMGANPSASGYIRLLNTGVIAWRNAANNADISALQVDANDDVTVGADLQMGGNTVLGATGAAGDLTLSSTLNATKGCVTIPDGQEGFKVGGTTNHATAGTNILTIFNGTAPVGVHAGNAASFYCDLVGAVYEMFVMDSGGTATQISPHDNDGYFYLNSYSPNRGRTIRVHVERMLKAIAEKFPGEFDRFIQELPGNRLCDYA